MDFSYTNFGSSVQSIWYTFCTGMRLKPTLPRKANNYNDNKLVMFTRLLMKIIPKNITHKSNLFFCRSNAKIKKMPSMVFTLKYNVVIFRSQYLCPGQFLESKIQQMSSIHLGLQTLTAVTDSLEK